MFFSCSSYWLCIRQVYAMATNNQFSTIVSFFEGFIHELFCLGRGEGGAYKRASTSILFM